MHPHICLIRGRSQSLVITKARTWKVNGRKMSPCKSATLLQQPAWENSSISIIKAVHRWKWKIPLHWHPYLIRESLFSNVNTYNSWSLKFLKYFHINYRNSFLISLLFSFEPFPSELFPQPIQSQTLLLALHTYIVRIKRFLYKTLSYIR